jgi:hypothetical protein
MKYFITLIVFFGVWLLASFINGVLSGICLMLCESKNFGNETFGLAMLFSFVFSVPLVGVVWIVTTAAQLNGTKGFSLFKTVVITATICSIAGAVLFVMVFNREFKEASYGVGLSIILSAITAVTIFRNQFKNYE